MDTQNIHLLIPLANDSDSRMAGAYASILYWRTAGMRVHVREHVRHDRESLAEYMYRRSHDIVHDLCMYSRIAGPDIMPKQQMFNDMAVNAMDMDDDAVLVIADSGVCIKPEVLVHAAEIVTEHPGTVVYPFDRWIHLHESVTQNILSADDTARALHSLCSPPNHTVGTNCRCTMHADPRYVARANRPDNLPVGGLIVIRAADYRRCGGENEHYYGWGYQDSERYRRYQAYGYDIRRLAGTLYHLHHPVIEADRDATRNVNRIMCDEAHDMSLAEYRAMADRFTWRDVYGWTTNETE